MTLYSDLKNTNKSNIYKRIEEMCKEKAMEYKKEHPEDKRSFEEILNTTYVFA